MNNKSELNTGNYKRIFWINGLLTIPLLLIFAWPYIVLSDLLSIPPIILYTGAILFSFPFTLTILHGHITLALGSAHRHHFYDWLEEHRLTYGLFFYPMFTSTRFRLVMFTISVMVFIVGWLVT